jgi:hypothetical protein
MLPFLDQAAEPESKATADTYACGVNEVADCDEPLAVKAHLSVD